MARVPGAGHFVQADAPADCLAVIRRHGAQGHVVLAADTTVVLGSRVLQKPANGTTPAFASEAIMKVQKVMGMYFLSPPIF